VGLDAVPSLERAAGQPHLTGLVAYYDAAVVDYCDIAGLGGGFGGLTAATAFAGVFEFSVGAAAKKFYYHWFMSDRYAPALVVKIGAFRPKGTTLLK